MSEKKRSRDACPVSQDHVMNEPPAKKRAFIPTTLADLSIDCMKQIMSSFSSIIQNQDWASISFLRFIMCGNKRMTHLVAQSLTTFRHVVPNEHHYSTKESRPRGLTSKRKRLARLKKQGIFVPYIPESTDKIALNLQSFDSLTSIEFYIDTDDFVQVVDVGKQSFTALGQLLSRLLCTVMENPPPNLQAFTISTNMHDKHSINQKNLYLDPFLPDRQALVKFLHSCPKLVILNVVISSMDYNAELGFQGAVNLALRRQYLNDYDWQPSLRKLQFVQILSNFRPNVSVLEYVMNGAMASGAQLSSLVLPFVMHQKDMPDQKDRNAQILERFGETCSRLLITSDTRETDERLVVSGCYLTVTPNLVYLDIPQMSYDSYLYDLPASLTTLKCNGLVFGRVAEALMNDGCYYIPMEHSRLEKVPNLPVGLKSLQIFNCFSHLLFLPPNCTSFVQAIAFDSVSRELPRQNTHLINGPTWIANNVRHDTSDYTTSSCSRWLYGNLEWNDLQPKSDWWYQAPTMLRHIRISTNTMAGSLKNAKQELDLRALISLETAHVYLEYLQMATFEKLDLGEMLPPSIVEFVGTFDVYRVSHRITHIINVDLTPLPNLVSMNLRYVYPSIAIPQVSFVKPIRHDRIEKVLVFLKAKYGTRKYSALVQGDSIEWDTKTMLRIDASKFAKDELSSSDPKDIKKLIDTCASLHHDATVMFDG